MNGGVLRGFTSGIVVSALMRRAVSVPEHRFGFADDPEDGGRRFKFSVFSFQGRGKAEEG
jgi:hypothetical protein